MKNLKDTLKKMDKRTKLTRSGAKASILPKCKYFEQMAFLHEKTGNKPTESNVLNVGTPSIVLSNTDVNIPPVTSPASSTSSAKKERREILHLLSCKLQSLSACYDLFKKIAK